MPRDNKKFKLDTASAIGSFSKNLLGLKFMQRAKKQVEQKVEKEQDKFDPKLCPNLKNKQQYIINQSYFFCDRLKFGRLSFKGMNTEIETLMYESKTATNPPSSAEKKRGPPLTDDSHSDDGDYDDEIDDLNTDDEL